VNDPAAAQTPAPEARRGGVLAAVERAGDRLPDPVLIFVVLIVAVVGFSAIGAGADWHVINPVSGETLRATSLLSSANLERLLVEMPHTLTGFPPLGYVLLIMLGAGLAEGTGLFAAAMRAAVRWAPRSLLTPLVILTGILGNQAVDAAFVILPPLAAALYVAAGRHPLVGIAAAFAGVAGGFSANLMPGSLDALLLGISEPAARLLVPGWQMNIAGNWYFIVGMTVLFLPVGWWVTERIVAPRMGEWTGPTSTGIGADELAPAAERRGLRAASVAAVLVIAFFGLLAWPLPWASVPGGAPLFDEAAAASGRLEQGLQPLFQSLVAGFFLLFLLTGLAYGRAAGVTRTHRDEIRLISTGMAGLAYYIVLAFVAGHFVALFNWSNLGAILAINGAEALASAGLPSPALLGGIVLLGATINLMIGSASAKWAMLAPVLVPMLMLLGVSPEMTTAAFRMGDSVTNPITPLMVYFPLVLTFCQRWDPRFGIGGLIALMLPYSLSFLVTGLAMTVLWVLFDVPLGPGAEVGYSLPVAAP